MMPVPTATALSFFWACDGSGTLLAQMEGLSETVDSSPGGANIVNFALDSNFNQKFGQAAHLVDRRHRPKQEENMSVWGLMLVLVLPTYYHVVAFMSPGKFAHQKQSLSGDHGRNNGPGVPTFTLIGNDSPLRSTPETVQQLGIDAQRDIHSFVSTIFVAEDGTNDYSSMLDGTQDQASTAGIAVVGCSVLALLLLQANRANNKDNNSNTSQDQASRANINDLLDDIGEPIIHTAYHAKRGKDLEETVASLSQTVVVLTKEIKAIKDTHGRRKVMMLEQQNAALQKELEMAKVNARSLSMQHVLIKSVEEKYATEPGESGAPKTTEPNLALDKGIVGESTNELFFVERASAQFSPASNEGDEEEGDYSDLLLLAMGVGTLSFLFSNF